MTLLLLRHGETPLNVARVLQPADTPLSPTGLLQVASLAQRLAGSRLAALVSSDLPRARQTAQAISSATGLTLETNPLLQERNFGDLRGLPYDTLGFDPIAMPGAPPGGESVAAFHARVAQAFAWLLQRQRAAAGPLAVVTHGLVVRAMLERHTQLPPGVTLPERIANASLSCVSVVPPYAATLIDSTTHLAAGHADDAHSLSGG